MEERRGEGVGEEREVEAEVGVEKVEETEDEQSRLEEEREEYLKDLGDIMVPSMGPRQDWGGCGQRLTCSDDHAPVVSLVQGL